MSEETISISVSVPVKRLQDFMRERVAELFGADARYRQTGVRDMIRRSVDSAAEHAVADALRAELPGLPALVCKAVRQALEAAVTDSARKAAREATAEWRKLGLDPARMTLEQLEWARGVMEKQKGAKS